MDFHSDVVLVGHDGPAHIRIANDRPILCNLAVYHGKRGNGLSVEFKLQTGLITMLGLTQTHNGRFKLVAAERESVPGDIPRSGNTHTRARFGMPVAELIERWSLAGPTHYLALGVGHMMSSIHKVSRVLGIECVAIG